MKNIFIFSCNVFTSTMGVSFFLLVFFGLSHFARRTDVVFHFGERSGGCVIPRALRHIFVLRSSSHLSVLQKYFYAPGQTTFYERSAMYLCSEVQKCSAMFWYSGSHFIFRVFHHMFCAPELTSSQERSVKIFALLADEKLLFHF